MSQEERVQLQRPPKRTIIRPVGIGVERVGDEVVVQILVSPFEFVTLELDENARDVLLKGLLGGIELATAAELPR